MLNEICPQPQGSTELRHLVGKWWNWKRTEPVAERKISHGLSRLWFFGFIWNHLGLYQVRDRMNRAGCVPSVHSTSVGFTSLPPPSAPLPRSEGLRGSRWSVPACAQSLPCTSTNMDSSLHQQPKPVLARPGDAGTHVQGAQLCHPLSLFSSRWRSGIGAQKRIVHSLVGFSIENKEPKLLDWRMGQEVLLSDGVRAWRFYLQFEYGWGKGVG